MTCSAACLPCSLIPKNRISTAPRTRNTRTSFFLSIRSVVGGTGRMRSGGASSNVSSSGCAMPGSLPTICGQPSPGTGIRLLCLGGGLESAQGGFLQGGVFRLLLRLGPARAGQDLLHLDQNALRDAVLLGLDLIDVEIPLRRNGAVQEFAEPRVRLFQGLRDRLHLHTDRGGIAALREPLQAHGQDLPRAQG